MGGWSLAPKSIEENVEEVRGVFFASQKESWDAFSHESYSAEFRLIAKCSMDFHVLSALWIEKVGYYFDQLLSNNAYGNRLQCNEYGEPKAFSLGSFKPYQKPFINWRDNGISAMRNALEQDKELVSLTADVSSFYHELNPDFMLNSGFLEKLDLDDLLEVKLHRIFIKSLIFWAEKTPLRKGLPVGLPASAVIANMALFELDEFIEKRIVPIYYGRYVDDILLVVENKSELKNIESFWDWLSKCSDGLLSRSSRHENNVVEFKTKYFRIESEARKQGRILFDNSKNKIFVLSGKSGKAFLGKIAEEIKTRASEWRAFPNLPTDPESVAVDLLKATDHNCEYADNLRKTDSLSLDRAGFAIKLRSFEAYERDLLPDDWKQIRHAFLDAVLENVLNPVKFFELEKYLSRIIQIATSCRDFEYLAKIIESLLNIMRVVDAPSCEVKIKALDDNQEWKLQREYKNKWFEDYFRIIAESVTSAIPSQEGFNAWNKHMEYILSSISNIIFDDSIIILGKWKEMESWRGKLFEADLAYLPLKFQWLPKEINSRNERLKSHKDSLELRSLPREIKEGVSQLKQWLKIKTNVPIGLLFPTRPFALNELYFIAPDPFNSDLLGELNKVIGMHRGFDVSNFHMPVFEKNEDHKRLMVLRKAEKLKYTVAVSSWHTSDESWTASATNLYDPSKLSRYQRLIRLVNNLISEPGQIDYFIMPELSIPAHWFIPIAQKLKHRGISFICGVEYLHEDSSNEVHNQVWASLLHDGLGYPEIAIYRQDKQYPALEEEVLLDEVAGKVLVPKDKWVNEQPPVIYHGNFFFSILICSELTNISYRSSIRGKVDALFVPEWNRDTESFNSLVESAALDMHAYVIQCNNREYGDSRIRAPYKDSWKRDILRVRGGIQDYYVVGEIDVLSLRQFQSNHKSPDKPYKPVPDGYRSVMCPLRKTLPK